jgi:hypothetical protein
MLNSRLAWAFCLSLGSLAASPFLRAQSDPASLPAHDAHQGLIVSADPYVSAERYTEKFGKHTPYDAGILAVEVYFRNDNDKPIRVNVDTVRLVIGQPGQSRQKLDALSPDGVADLVLHEASRAPRPRRLPLPLPGGAPRTDKGKDWNQLDATLRSASMDSDILPPNATTHGFFYFDIGHHYDWLPNAHLEVPDLAFMLDNKALFFFEVDLASAATHSSAR